MIPVNVSPIEHHLKNIHDVFSIIRFQCRENKETDTTQCQNLLQPLETLYNDIKGDFKSISHIISNSISKRSAWIGGIGVVFKHIFGTLDEDDAKNYENAIRVLYDNDKQLKDSIKKTIMVSQSAISNINQSIHELNTNEAKLNDVIEGLSFSMTNVTDRLDRLSFKVRLSNILNILQTNLLAMSFKVEDLLNSILLVKSNILHPSILNPSQMYNDIVSNLKILPKYKDFPINLEINNIHALINTADLTCYYVDYKLMFIVKLPLVSLEQFNIYKSIPLPTPHANGKLNSFAMIIPSGQFLALSKDKLSYTYLKDMNNCKQIPTNTYLCETTEIYAVLHNPSCETEIITKALNSLPDICVYKFLVGDVDIWHRLNNNKWVFVQSKPTRLSIECNTNVSEIVISGTGVLNVPANCVAFYKNIKFITKVYPKLNVPIATSYFNIINDSCCNFYRFSKISATIPFSKIKSVNLDSLNDFKSVSNQISKDLMIKAPSFNNHVTFPIFSILSISIISLAVMYYICFKTNVFKRFCTKSETIPTSQEETLTLNDSTRSAAPRLRIE